MTEAAKPPEGASVHSPGCWAWGSRHYECAMKHIAKLSKELESAALIVGDMRVEMAQLKVEAGYDLPPRKLE